ncbi:MAG: VWA domain-containing protein [Acidobacteriota bacterium]
MYDQAVLARRKVSPLVVRLLILGCALAAVLSAASPSTETPPLAPAFERWLEEVKPLISDEERAVFSELPQDYQRRAFIEEFWRVRDPHPETARNELREGWESRREEAAQRFGAEGDDRALMFAVFGEPAETLPGRCPGVIEPLEIWRFAGFGRSQGEFHLVFIRRGGRYELWSPSQGIGRLSVGLTGSVLNDGGFVREVAENCFRGRAVAAALVSAVDYEKLRDSGDLFPAPGEEWLQSFLGRTTDLPQDGETFDGEFALDFPGRYQSRTVLQGIIAVPLEAVTPSEHEKYPSYDFVLDGEVLRKGELFENFRYRFHFPVADVSGEIPLLFQRYLRPGTYELVLRVRDLGSGRFYRHDEDLEVPFAARDARPAAVTPRDVSTRETALRELAEEANASLGRGDWSIRLLPPPPTLQVGNTRVEAVTAGEGIARVRFSLNGRPVLTKARPPYSVEINLGEAPRIHEVEAAALDAAGEVLARDRFEINAGPHRFDVRLVEPQAGKTYRESLRAMAEVQVPEGDRLDRVEFFFNEQPVATLYQPPFAQPILLSSSKELDYVRVVAHLTDGNSVEDLVFINAPNPIDVVDVQVVELFTTVLDRRGRPIDDLPKEAFAVTENGTPQEIRRFERVIDLPIYAGILLDNSASMVEEIEEASKAALRFFETVVTPKDRAAVMTFNHQPELLVRFTNNREVLAGGVAAITAEGGTALYDSLIYALYYFSGIQGKRVVILLSDGDDQVSRYGFDDALEYARRSGVAVYSIGLGLPGKDTRIRMLLQRLADETGGRSFFIQRATELGRVYETIEEELRSQYLLTYQSTDTSDEDVFRPIEVEVDRPGAEAKTIRGYYP